MAKIGLDLYPDVKTIKGIINDNLKGVFIDDCIRLNFSENPIKLFNDYKIGILGMDNFVVSGNLEDRIKERVKQIQGDDYDINKFLYNPVEIYKLANELSYVINKMPEGEDKLIANTLLRTELARLAKKGANFEEVKMYICYDNFLNKNDFDDNYNNVDMLEDYLENAMRTCKVLDQFKKLSPYENAIEKIIENKNQNLTEILKDFDGKMINEYLFDKIFYKFFKALITARNIQEDIDLDRISKFNYYQADFYPAERSDVSRRRFNDGFCKEIKKFIKTKLNSSVDCTKLINYYISFVLAISQKNPNVKTNKIIDNFLRLVSAYNSNSGFILSSDTNDKENF